MNVELSLDCLSDHFGSDFVVPDLTPKYRRTGIQLDGNRPKAAVVFYESETSDYAPSLRLEIDLRTEIGPAGLRSLQLGSGETLWLTDRGDVSLGNFRAGKAVYAVALGTAGANNGATDDLQVWIAERIVNQVADSSPDNGGKNVDRLPTP